MVYLDCHLDPTGQHRVSGSGRTVERGPLLKEVVYTVVLHRALAPSG